MSDHAACYSAPGRPACRTPGCVPPSAASTVSTAASSAAGCGSWTGSTLSSEAGVRCAEDASGYYAKYAAWQADASHRPLPHCPPAHPPSDNSISVQNLPTLNSDDSISIPKMAPPPPKPSPKPPEPGATRRHWMLSRSEQPKSTCGATSSGPKRGQHWMLSRRRWPEEQSSEAGSDNSSKPEEGAFPGALISGSGTDIPSKVQGLNAVVEREEEPPWERLPSWKLFSLKLSAFLEQALPINVMVKNTFIHFDDSEQANLPLSAPAILTSEPLQLLDSKKSPDEVSKVSKAKLPRAMEPMAHADGTCKPCAYFWGKQDGCRSGDACRFCHQCQPGELKKRRKEKDRLLRLRRRLEPAAQMAPQGGATTPP